MIDPMRFSSGWPLVGFLLKDIEIFDKLAHQRKPSEGSTPQPGSPQPILGVRPRMDLPSSPLPKWFTPSRLLMIFCATNLFVYLDRGTGPAPGLGLGMAHRRIPQWPQMSQLTSGLISSNGVNGSPSSEANPGGSGIQGAFKLTYFEDGLIPAAFMASVHR